MEIKIVKGYGEAKTSLSAFDAALKDAGVYNYNLIYLSSIIPPGSIIKKQKKYNTPENEYGFRLYVVKAEIRSAESGKFISAGIGWYQLDDGRGMFVEHEMIGETRVAVISEMNFRIETSIQDLCEFRNIKFEPKRMNSEVVITKVSDNHTALVVLAVFQSEGWENK